MNAGQLPHASPTEDPCPTRETLLVRLKDWGDQRSWQEFFDVYWRLIYNVALKSGLTPAEAEDVVQETVLSVAKKMRDFKYDPALGSFKGFLLQLVGWKINNQFLKRGPAAVEGPAGANDTATIERLGDPHGMRELEALWSTEWQEHLMHAALLRVQKRANPLHFQAFELNVLKKQPVAEVASFLGITAGQVYLAKHRVARLIQKEVRYLEQKAV